MDDLDPGELRVGGRNHLPGVSGHWCDSGPGGSSSSSSGDPLRISRITGGKSSHVDAGGRAVCVLQVLTRDAGG